MADAYKHKDFKLPEKMELLSSAVGILHKYKFILT